MEHIPCPSVMLRLLCHKNRGYESGLKKPAFSEKILKYRTLRAEYQFLEKHTEKRVECSENRRDGGGNSEHDERIPHNLLPRRPIDLERFRFCGKEKRGYFLHISAFLKSPFGLLIYPKYSKKSVLSMPDQEGALVTFPGKCPGTYRRLLENFRLIEKGEIELHDALRLGMIERILLIANNTIPYFMRFNNARER